MIKVAILKHPDARALKDINRLIPQLSAAAKPLAVKTLRALLKSSYATVVVATDSASRDTKKIIGIGMLVTVQLLVGSTARIEDVVVDEACRGKGVGGMIVRRLVAEAKKKKAKSIRLTSNPARVSANALYKELDFEQYDTNAYKMKL